MIQTRPETHKTSLPIRLCLFLSFFLLTSEPLLGSFWGPSETDLTNLSILSVILPSLHSLVQWFSTGVPWKNSRGATNFWTWSLLTNKLKLGVSHNCTLKKEKAPIRKGWELLLWSNLSIYTNQTSRILPFDSWRSPAPVVRENKQNDFLSQKLSTLAENLILPFELFF